MGGFCSETTFHKEQEPFAGFIGGIRRQLFWIGGLCKALRGQKFDQGLPRDFGHVEQDGIGQFLAQRVKYGARLPKRQPLKVFLQGISRVQIERGQKRTQSAASALMTQFFDGFLLKMVFYRA